MRIQAFKIALENAAFRKVLFTHKHLQMAVMNIKKGSQLEREKYRGEAAALIVAGNVEVIVDDVKTQAGPGDAICVPGGSEYNIINTGEENLKMIVFYAPPEYSPDSSHGSKESEIMDPYKKRK